MNRVVVWDVDDVLNDLMRAWFTSMSALSREASAIRYDDLLENPPHSILGIGANEYLESLDAFRLSDAYADQAPDHHILAWLEEHGPRARHVALTATSLRGAPVTAEWVLRNFGRWIRDFAFIPASRPDQDDLVVYDIDKGDWLRRLGPSAILVDDAPKNVASAQAAGIAAVLWPRPWNRGSSPDDALRTLTNLVLMGHS